MDSKARPGENIYCPVFCDTGTPWLPLNPRQGMCCCSQSHPWRFWLLAVLCTILATSKQERHSPRLSLQGPDFPQGITEPEHIPLAAPIISSLKTSVNLSRHVWSQCCTIKPWSFQMSFTEEELTTGDTITAPEPCTSSWRMLDDLPSTRWFVHTAAFNLLRQPSEFNDLSVLSPVTHLT